MAVPVMEVRAVRMLVRGALVPMDVVMLEENGVVVDVNVVTIIMPMGVLVLDGLVTMTMSVNLGQVQVHAAGEENPGKKR